jgi:hypothetical protein
LVPAALSSQAEEQQILTLYREAENQIYLIA